jgi:hypothetical protein
VKRLSHFLLFHKTGQFLANFLAFLPRLCTPTCSLLACFTAQAMSQVAPAAEILNPATTGPYGAAYPYGYYSELPPNPPAPDSSGNSTNSVNENSTAGSGNTSETPAADNSESQAASANSKPPAAMPEPGPEAKAVGGDEEKLSPEQKALLEAARKKIEKTENREETETEKPAAEKKGLLEEMAASRKKQDKEEQELARQTPEVLPESPARTVLKEMKQGLYAKALVDLENLKRLNPQAYELDYLSAINHIMLKQPAQARAYYEKILHSQAPDALKQLAQTGLKKLHSKSQH